MRKLNLESKIRKMFVSDIILHMIESLKNPSTKIAMRTYGMKDNNKVCYGCASTNFICGLYKIDISKNLPNFENTEHGFSNIGIFKNKEFVGLFELAINDLRNGFLEEFNSIMSYLSLDTIPDKFLDEDLPRLKSNYSLKQLNDYRKFAIKLKKYEDRNSK